MEIHPYIADLPIFQDRVDAMAESIAEIGLLHPISLDTEGRVIGGRHRLAACEKAGVEPQFETRDENPLVFMLHDNDDRKHQTMGQLAAERALTLHSAGHRSNGRWDYGTVEFPTGGKFRKSESNRLHESGVVLDFLGRDTLAAIAAGTETLKEQFAIANEEKQRREAEERRRIDEVRDEQQREDQAGRFFDNHPEAQAWLDSKPQGAFETMRGAYAAYMEHDREARRKEQEKKRKEEEEKREKRERIERHARYLEAFVMNFQWGLDMATWPERDEVLKTAPPDISSRFLEIEATYLTEKQQ